MEAKISLLEVYGWVMQCLQNSPDSGIVLWVRKLACSCSSQGGWASDWGPGGFYKKPWERVAMAQWGASTVTHCFWTPRLRTRFSGHLRDSIKLIPTGSHKPERILFATKSLDWHYHKTKYSTMTENQYKQALRKFQGQNRTLTLVLYFQMHLG